MSVLRKLVWLYLILLVMEGALRKWVVPALDAPLLVIRDPLVVLIYYQAWRNGLIFSNGFTAFTAVMAVITSITAILLGEATGIANILVTAYGFRTDYLQIPLIFLIPQILNRDDVIAMGKLLFFLAIPMTIIVLLQFKSPPGSFINKGTMATHYGTVRPSGTFSFVTGVTSYFALTAAFLLYGYLQGRTFKMWQMIPVMFGILVSAAVSGSRGGLATIGIVVAAAIFTVIVRGKGGLGIVVAAVVIALAVPILASTDVGQQGAEQLTQRFKDAGRNEGNAEGFVGRFLGSMALPIVTAGKVPFFGYGLGLGTNAALGFYHSTKDLGWPEEEWARLIFECGGIFGLLLCIFRVALTVYLARMAFAACRRDNILPILIFASCGILVLNGQWGVPTTLGFAIFGAGLTLAACVEPEYYDDEDDEYEHEEGDEHTDDEESDHSHESVG